MESIKSIRRNKKGQFIIAAALLVALVILAVALQIYISSNVHHEFRYKSYKEIVENADADFQNALTLALAKATHAYAGIPLWGPLEQTSDTSSYEVLRSAAVSSINFWKLAVTRSFAGTGFSTEYYFDRATLLQAKKVTPKYTIPNRWLYNLTKVYWFYPESISAIGSDIAINVTGMGFKGFRSYHMASLLLIMDVEDLDQQFSEGNVNHLKVTLLRERDDPVHDLSDENFLLVSFDLNTGTWRNVPLTAVKYMGEGNFTLSFPPSEVVAGPPPPLASPPAPAAVPKYVNPQQAGTTTTTTRTRTVTVTSRTTRTIPTTTTTRTRTTTSTRTVSTRTTTTRRTTTTTTRSTTVTRYVTSTRWRTRARDATTTTSTRTRVRTTTRSTTSTSTRTVVSSTVTTTVTTPSATSTTTTTTSSSGTGTITSTTTTTTTVTAGPAPPRPLGGEVPPGTATVTVTVTTTRTVTRTDTTYSRTTTRWVDRTVTRTSTRYTSTITTSSTRTRTTTRRTTTTITRRTTMTTTTYRNTITRTATTTRTTTIWDTEVRTTTRVLADETVTETVTEGISTETETAYGVGGLTTTTTTTTTTKTELPIRYSKWFQLLVRDTRGIIVEGMTYSHLDFEIRDWTRGPGSGVPPADLPPGFSQARQITVENNLQGDDLESGYTVGFSLDTASLVSSGKMLADGRDLWIYYYQGGWIPVDRHVLRMNTDSTEVWFKTQADIGPGGVDGNYFLCYNNSAAGLPPSSLNNVYVFYDDFSINSTGTYEIGRWLSLHGNLGEPYVSPTWNSTGGWIDFDTGDNVVCGLKRTLTGGNLYAEMKVSWRQSYPIDTTVGIGIRWMNATKYYLGHVSYDSYTSPAIAENEREGYLATPPGDTYFPKDGTWHKLAFAVWNDRMKLWLDDQEYLTAADSSIGGTPSNDVVFEFAQIEGSADDFMVREYVEPEPTILLGFEVYPSGAGFSSSDSYETYNLEVMYNATSGTAWYWNGEQLEISGGYPPVPPIPIRQLRVNTTAWGVGDELLETPSQVEQWSSDLRTPLYVLSVGNVSSRFNDRSKLSFNVDFPWNVTVQKVRIWWVDDLEVAPPAYGINMTVAGPFVIVNNGRYELQLLAEEGYSTWIDWSVSLRYADYHAEYALFGYDIYEIPPPGSGRYWIPMKIPAGSWDAPVMYGPVRAIAHRRSSMVYDYPNDVEINDELDHEMYVVVPYNTTYFFWSTNSTWLKTVTPRYLTFIAQISGDASDVGNSTLRVGKYAYQDPKGWVRTGSFPGGASVELERLGENFGYWAAQYRDGFGEAMFVNDRFLEVIKNDSRHPRPDLFIFTTGDNWRRTVEYDAEDKDFGSIVTIPQGENYLLSVAAWAYGGGWEEARLYHRMFVEEYYPTIFVLED